MRRNIIDLRKKKTTEQRPKTERSASAPEIAKAHTGQELTWNTFEFPKRPKQHDVWVRRVVLIAIPFVLIFLVQGNVLGVIIVILSALAFLLAAFKEPKRITVHMDEKSITIGERVHPYDTFSSFWIFTYSPKENELSLAPTKTLGQNLSVPLGEIDPERVRATLLPHLPEEEQTPSAVDAWMRQIGF